MKGYEEIFKDASNNSVYYKKQHKSFKELTDYGNNQLAKLYLQRRELPFWKFYARFKLNINIRKVKEILNEENTI